MKINRRIIERNVPIEFSSLCSTCVYKYRMSEGCEAFPKHIPTDILIGKFVHNKIYPNQDNNIIYKGEKE